MFNKISNKLLIQSQMLINIVRKNFFSLKFNLNNNASNAALAVLDATSYGTLLEILSMNFQLTFLVLDSKY